MTSRASSPAAESRNTLPAYELWQRVERTDHNEAGVYRWMIWLVGPGEDASAAEWFVSEDTARERLALLARGGAQ